MLIAPFFVDWTAYRADFEREASRILGHPVSVRGEASARILPFPSVTFTDVVVAGEGGQAPLMTVAGFRMDAELAPYLSGEIRIFSMTFDRPQLRLPVSAKGDVVLVGADSALPEGAMVVLEDVEITDGRIIVDNGLTGRSHALTDIDARLSARALTGPFAGTGTLTAGGQRLDLVLSSGPLAAETGLPLKLTVAMPALDASLVLDGSAAVKDARPSFSGTLRATSPLPRPAEAAGSASAAEGEGAAARAAAVVDVRGLLPAMDVVGKVIVTAGGIEVTEARLSAGGGETPYILTGSGSLGLGRLPRFTLALEGEQVDVDAIVEEAATPASGGEAPGEGEPRAPVTFEQRLEAARAVFAAVPKPGIPGTVSITLPVVVAGDTTIRDVTFTVSPTDTGWSVERFLAELPGRTRMEATGLVGLDEALSFSGDLLVASRQPSGFSDWLTGAVDPAVRALPQAGFSAKVDLTRDAQVFEGLEVDVGGDVLTGRLERSGPREGRRMAAELQAGRVDLDALLALSRLFTGEDDSIADADRMALKIAAGPVTYGGASAGRIDADLSYDGTRLAIAKLAVDDLAGANLAMSGDLGGLGGDLSGRLSVALDAAAPAGVIAFLKDRLPPSPAMDVLVKRGPSLGPLSLQGEVKTVVETPGDKPTLQAELNGSAAKTDVSLKLALGNGIYAEGAAGRFGLDLSLTNAAPSVLLGQLGLDSLPIDLPSPLSAQIQMSAGATGPVVASAAMRAPETELTAEGNFDVATSGVTAADFGLAAKSADLGPWLLATGFGFGLSPLEALPVDLSATLGFADGDVSLDGLVGTVGATEMSGAMSRHAGGAVGGELAFSDLSLPWLATLVYGRSAEGAAWPAEEFREPLLPPLDLALDIDAERLSFAGGGGVEDVAARLSASRGEVTLSALKGAIGGGYVSGSATMRNANGIGGASLDAEFSGVDIGSVALSLAGDVTGDNPGDGAAEAGIAGTLDATVSLDGTGQSYQALVSALSGAGRLSVGEASFAGLRQGLFGPVLEAADAQGFVPGNETTAALLQGLNAGARYGLPDFDADVSIAAGVARMAATRLEAPGESLTAEASLDLATLDVSGALRLDLDPGDEAIDGATPSILYGLEGPLTSPRLVPDVQPLASYLSVRAYEREEARVEAMQEQLQERLRLRREVRYARWRERERIAAQEAQAAAAEVERLRLERQQQDEERERQDAERQRAAMAAAEALRAQVAEQQRIEAERQAEEARLAAAAAAREAAAAAAQEAAEAAARRADEARRSEAERQAEEARRAEEANWAEEVRRALDRERSPPPAGARVPEPPSPARPANAEPTRSRAAPPVPPALDLENPVGPVPPPPPTEFEALPGVSNPLDF